jgi:pilus assembly protein CpaF
MPDTPAPPAPHLGSLPLFAPVPQALQRPSRPPVAPAPAPRAPAAAAVTSYRRGPAVAPGAPATLPPATSDVDWRLVRSMRGQAADQLSQILANRPDLDKEAEQERAKQMILDLLRSYDDDASVSGGRTFAVGELNKLQQAVYDSLYGLGRIQPLVDWPEVENVSILGCDNVWLLMADGRFVRGPAVAESDDELIADIQFLANQADREFSRAEPNLDMRLPAGQRLAATAWLSPRPLVSIRVHRIIDVEINDLITNGTLHPIVGAFLKAAVKAGLSIIITGDRGSGKSVLLRACASEWHPTEPITTLESELEISLHELPHRHHQVFAMEARSGGTEKAADGTRVGAIDLNFLVSRVQRFPPNKLVVGEVRGAEVIAMFKFMEASKGSMSTTHARSASAGVNRLVTMAMDGGTYTEEWALRAVAQNVDLIVHVGFEAIQVLDTLQAQAAAGVARPDDAGLYRRHRRYVADVIALELGDRSGRRGHSEEQVFARGGDGEVLGGVIPESLRERLTEAGFDFDAYNRMAR